MKTFKQHQINEAFTRQHYVAVAKAIKTALGKVDGVVAENAIESLANDLAELFKDDNPRFDKGYFLNACGV